MSFKCIIQHVMLYLFFGKVNFSDIREHTFNVTYEKRFVGHSTNIGIQTVPSILRCAVESASQHACCSASFDSNRWRQKNEYYDHIALLYLETRRCRYQSIIFVCFYLSIAVVISIDYSDMGKSMQLFVCSVYITNTGQGRERSYNPTAR